MKTYLVFLLLFISSSYLYADIDNKININTACRDGLITLPNIGYGIADRVIEHRSDSPFEAIEDLIKKENTLLTSPANWIKFDPSNRGLAS